MTGLKYFSFEPGENRHCGMKYAVNEMIDTSGAVDCSFMFQGASASVNFSNEMTISNNDVGIYLSDFDTSNVTNFENMFRGCENIMINLDNYNQPNAKNNLFDQVGKAIIGEEDAAVSRFSFRSATNMKEMFCNAGYSKLNISFNELKIWESMPSQVIFPTNGENPENICDASGMFKGSSLYRIDMSKMKFLSVINFEEMFSEMISFSFEVQFNPGNRATFDTVAKLVEAVDSHDNAKIEEALTLAYQNQITVNDLISSNSNDAKSYFGTEILFNQEENWGPTVDGYPISMDRMFAYSNTANFHLEKLNTVNVKSMRSMFLFTPFLSSVSVSDDFDTSNVESMNRMFAYSGIITGEARFFKYNKEWSEVPPSFKIKDGCVLAEMFANAHLPVDLSV